MSDEEILDSIKKIGLYRTIKKHKIENIFFIKNSTEIDIDLLFRFVESGDYLIDEVFINHLIESSIIERNRIYELPMNIYIEFSDSFIENNKDYINWNRLFLYYITNEYINIWDYEKIIIEHDLWHLASTIELPKDFIDKYHHKLDWKYISMLNDFEDDDLDKYPDAILPLLIIERRKYKNE